VQRVVVQVDDVGGDAVFFFFFFFVFFFFFFSIFIFLEGRSVVCLLVVRVGVTRVV